jgi:hypothetical protein
MTDTTQNPQDRSPLKSDLFQDITNQHLQISLIPNTNTIASISNIESTGTDALIQNILTTLRHSIDRHLYASSMYSRYNKLLEIPALVIITFLATSIGVTIFDGGNSTLEWIKLGLSSFVVMMGILRNHFGFEKKASSHDNTSKLYAQVLHLAESKLLETEMTKVMKKVIFKDITAQISIIQQYELPVPMSIVEKIQANTALDCKNAKLVKNLIEISKQAAQKEKLSSVVIHDPASVVALQSQQQAPPPLNKTPSSKKLNTPQPTFVVIRPHSRKNTHDHPETDIQKLISSMKGEFVVKADEPPVSSESPGQEQLRQSAESNNSDEKQDILTSLRGDAAVRALTSSFMNQLEKTAQRNDLVKSIEEGISTLKEIESTAEKSIPGMLLDIPNNFDEYQSIRKKIEKGSVKHKRGLSYDTYSTYASMRGVKK